MKIKQKILFALFALSMLLLMLPTAGCNTEQKTEYEIKYVGEDSQFICSDTVEEGTLYTTRSNFDFSQIYEAPKNTTHILAYVKPSYTYIELGIKQFIVNEPLTITIPYSFNRKMPVTARIFYTLETQHHDDTYELILDDLTVKELIMTSQDGISYRVTAWQDRFGNVYQAGDSINESLYTATEDGNAFLYSYTKEPVGDNVLTYDKNNATSGSAPLQTAYSDGTSATISGNTGSLTKPGYTFAGWNTKANGTGTTYTAGGSLTMTSNTTLYAKWDRNIWITYDPNYADAGSAPSGAYYSGTSCTIPGNTGSLTKSGCTFGGWNTRKDGTGITYAGGSTMVLLHNVTLYAKWDLPIVAGNGITISAVNTSDTTIDDTHKLYWFITTDQYCLNSAAVVASGTLSSVSATTNVDVAAGTYYVWGFIDVDGSGGRSAGDLGQVSMIAVSGYELGDLYTFEIYHKAVVNTLSVTSSSGYLSAGLRFSTSSYAFPSQFAVLLANFKYTGSSVSLDDDHPLNVIGTIGVSDFSSFSSTQLIGGCSLTTSATNQILGIYRLTLGTTYYFGAFVNADGGANEIWAESGDPAVYYLNNTASGTPDGFTPTVATNYSIIQEFDDTYITP